MALAACGGSGGGGADSCTPGPTASINITASGVSPVNVCVAPEGQVTFTNSDSGSSHDIEFEASGCPPVGELTSGATKTVTFPTQQNCSFHDGSRATNAAFQGTVAVTAVVVTGGGY
jgi:hypothetical protein